MHSACSCQSVWLCYQFYHFTEAGQRQQCICFSYYKLKKVKTENYHFSCCISMLVANMLKQQQIGETKSATVWTRIRLVLVGADRLTAIEDIYDKKHINQAKMNLFSFYYKEHTHMQEFNNHFVHSVNQLSLDFLCVCCKKRHFRFL